MSITVSVLNRKKRKFCLIWWYYFHVALPSPSKCIISSPASRRELVPLWKHRQNRIEIRILLPRGAKTIRQTLYYIYSRKTDNTSDYALGVGKWEGIHNADAYSSRTDTPIITARSRSKYLSGQFTAAVAKYSSTTYSSNYPNTRGC